MPTGSTIHTILQCFVDINLETNENSIYSTDSLNLLDVSFEQSTYIVDEGQFIDVTVSLSAPSVNAYEEIEVDIVSNNTSIIDFDTLSKVYPQTIAFSAGQQSHTFRFFINSDFLEEGQESFDLIIGNFINVNPGQFITTQIKITDLTDLKEVYINTQGGYVSSNPSTTPPSQILTFQVIEGDIQEITISLDSPSIFGVEEVTVQTKNVTAGSSDYSIIGTTNLTWNIGEQHKTIQIKGLIDQDIESDERIEIKLINPINVNIINISEASVVIFDNSPKSLYAQINLQGIYTQIGGTNLQNVTQLRTIRDNEETSYSSSADIMLLKFGEKFRSEVQNNSTITPGGNAIRTTTTTGFFPSTTTIVDTIFFGKNPNTGDYGDVRLKITNKGSFPVKINGTQLNAGTGSIVLVVDKFNFSTILPANNVLIPAGAIYQGNTLPSDTLVEAVYEFEIQTDYTERSFVLKKFNNTISTNKTINLGIHTFSETYDISVVSDINKQYNLVTTYNQVNANYAPYPYYNSPRVCIPLSEYINNSRFFPENPTDAISISSIGKYARINGFAILSDNSIQYSNGIGNGPTEYAESSYFKVEFLPNGQTIGITCAPISYPGTTNNIAWTSLPFELVS